MKTALICGITGQDGAYLAQLLLAKGYRVVGSSRDAFTAPRDNLKWLGIDGRVSMLSIAVNDFRSVLQAITRVAPDEIYNLAGQSSVGLSFEQPMETLESIATGTVNFLEAIRFSGKPIRFYNAGSGECFGNSGDAPANEETPFRPRSPYAVAKAAAFWEVATYREAYSLFACSGLLFNHESPLRHERFVTRKIAAGAVRIARGSRDRLRLGALDVRRDWGWAPEYVVAMWMMLQRDRPEDFVIATGETRSLEEFIAAAFAAVGLDWREWVESDPDMLRPVDIAAGRADPGKAERELGWRAALRMDGVVGKLVEAELQRQTSS
jgi:GDPmannose 4,6-dehydratase